MTPDPAAAKRFYTSLFGWKTMPFTDGDPANPYDMWTVGGAPIGGVMKLGADQASMGVPPNWLPAVQVNNVDESARKATSLGGSVVMGPIDIPKTGRYAVIGDPTSATIAIFQASGPSDSYDGTPVVGKPSWHELMTTDVRRATEFYRQLFGWEVVRDNDMGPLGMYREFGLKGRSFGGMYTRPPEMAEIPPFWLPYVYVQEVKAATAAAQKLGAKVVNGPIEVPGGDWVVVMSDPQGAAFAMHAAKPTLLKSVKNAVKKAVKKTVTKAKKAVKKAKTSMKKKAKAKARSKPKARSKARKKPAKKKGRRR